MILSGFVLEDVCAGPKKTDRFAVAHPMQVPSSSSVQKAEYHDDVELAKSRVNAAMHLRSLIYDEYATRDDQGNYRIFMTSLEDARFFGYVTKIEIFKDAFDKNLKDKNIVKVLFFGHYADITREVVEKMYQDRKNKK